VKSPASGQVAGFPKVSRKGHRGLRDEENEQNKRPKDDEIEATSGSHTVRMRRGADWHAMHDTVHLRRSDIFVWNGV
jgi:hypothetical protein